MKKLSYYLLVLMSFMSTAAYSQNMPDDNSTAPSGVANLITLPQPFDQGGNTAPQSFNYTRTWKPVVPMTDSTGFTLTTGYSFASSSVRVQTDYINGFGQKILSLIHRTDVLHDLATAYDNRSTLSKATFLSYPTANQNSHFQLSPFADQRAYFQNMYPGEGGASYSLSTKTYPGGVPEESTLTPGKSFVGQNRGSSLTGQYNSSADAIRIWSLNAVGMPISSGIFPDNVLIRKVTTGQHDAASEEYINKNGQIICKRNQVGPNTWLSTYYVYNDFGKIRWILTPKAVAALSANGWAATTPILNGLCYQYNYDKFGDVILKGVPGTGGIESTVYDIKHRPILFQNPLLLSQGKWQFSVYDKEGRIVMSGLVTSSNTQSAWTNQVNSTTNPAQGSLLYYLTVGFNGTYPASNTSIAGCEVDEFTYYDTYDQNPALAGRTFDNSKSAEYLSGAEFVYPQPSKNTFGLVTGKRTFIPNANGNLPSAWINSVFFYDQFGRNIQIQAQGPFNTNSQWDVTTTQYNFEGKAVLVINDHHAWAGANKQATTVYKKYVYDLTTGKLNEIRQKTDSDPTWRFISQEKYDILGRVSEKRLGGIEHQVFDYNMRGQLTGMNKDFVNYPNTSQTQDMTFGLTLSYDNGFTNPRYDGNISGFIWRGGGSHSPRRAYGYSYDQIGRMTVADFREFTLASGNPFQQYWNNENTDYSVSNISYDENGNMLSLKQRGVDLGGLGIPQPVDIDNLTYSYQPNSNRLDRVEDAVSINYHLEDFVNNNANSTDYTYDADGNLASDANKGVSQITYNHQDLPVSVSAAGGTITNIYDASGELLQKTISAPVGAPTVYRYWGGFTYRNDSLLYFLHDEGRCRWLADSNLFKYDYFTKDHLGNVRTTVAADYGGTKNYLATYEIAAANTENLIFEGVEGHRAPKPGSSNTSDIKAAMLNGQDANGRVGTSLLIRVMAGDKFSASAFHYYDTEEQSNISTSTEDMMGSIISSLAGGTTAVGNETGGNPVEKLFTPENYTGVYDAIKENATDPALPRAYLNYVVFDENMRIVPEQSGALQVSAVGNSWQQIALPDDITIGQNGYLAVYISNEQHKNVFFDYLNITYYRGRLLEEQHYYPHGLTIRAGSNTPLVNKYLYQGKLLQDELGLELYDFHARQYDPQIGRFWGIDPADQFPSGYTGMANDPANNIDPTGMASGNYASSYGTSNGASASSSQREDWDTNLYGWDAFDAQTVWSTLPGETENTTSTTGQGEADPSIGLSMKNLATFAPAIAVTAGEAATATGTGIGLVRLLSKVGTAEGVGTVGAAAAGFSVLLCTVLVSIPTNVGQKTRDWEINPNAYALPGMGIVLPRQLQKLRADYGRLAREFTGILTTLGTMQSKPAQVYELYATVPAYYPEVTRGIPGMSGMTHLDMGQTWKYGITTEDNVYGRGSNSRYSGNSKFYQYPTGIDYRVIFRGNKLQAQFVEHMMIMNYFFIHGALPPGNRVPW